MPTYQYACTECGHRLEAVQSFTDAPLSECPACQGRLRKVFNSVGIVFKGSGFYRTDSRGKEGAAATAGGGEKSGEGGKSGDGAKSGDGGSTDKAAKPAAESAKSGGANGAGGGSTGSGSSGSGSSGSGSSGSGSSGSSKAGAGSGSSGGAKS